MLGKKLNKKVLLLGVSIFFILLLLKLVDIPDALHEISSANLGLLALSSGLGILSSVINAARIKTILSKVGNPGFKFIWLSGYLSAIISLLAPVFLGGFGFAYLLSRKAKIPYKKIFSFIFLDFLCGISVTFVLGGLAIIYFSSKKIISVNFNLNELIPLAAIMSLALVAIILILPRIKNLKTALNSIIGIKGYLDLRVAIKYIFYVVAGIIIGTIGGYIGYAAFGMHPNIIEFVLAGGLFGIMGLIPGSPTKIGQYETFGVLTLPYLLNLDKDAVFAMLLTTHVISIVISMIFGIISFVVLSNDKSIQEDLLKFKKYPVLGRLL